jgi:site-specific recombinase XerD
VINHAGSETTLSIVASAVVADASDRDPGRPLGGWRTVHSRELRALRRLQRDQVSKSPFVFISERGTPFSKRGFQAMVERAARAAGFDMKIHPHMLRHSCGYKLANDGVDTRTIQSYLGHKSIQHTVRYTELAPTRFKSLFRD